MQRVLIIALLLAAAAFVAYSFWSRGEDDNGRPLPAGAQVYTADGTLVRDRGDWTPRNLILILLDTVCRDSVALGDDADADMPALSRLADRGVAFRQAGAPAPWTIPTIASVLTGLHPSEHGCREYGEAGATPKLLPSIVTYAEALHTSYDYQTAAYSDVPWYRTAANSLLQGFEAGSSGQGANVRGPRPMESGFWLHGGGEIIDPWIETLDPKRPFFLFLHTYDAHDPYGEENHPPAVLPLLTDRAKFAAAINAYPSTLEFTPKQVLEVGWTDIVGRWAMRNQRGPETGLIATKYAWAGFRADPDWALAGRLRDKYREGVRWTDDGVGQVIEFLESRGLFENTLVVFFSDHGEAFGEHGMLGHGRQLDEELIHVPMVMYGPGPFGTPRVVDESVSVIDIMPTFMDWIGAPDLPDVRGRSLLPLLRGDGRGRAVLAEAIVTPEMTGDGSRRVLQAVRDTQWKYVVEYDIIRGAIEERLFDLRQDPEERTNLLAEGTELSSVGLTQDFCDQIELARDRVWEAAESIASTAMTPYGAGVPTTDQPRPPPACPDGVGSKPNGR